MLLSLPLASPQSPLLRARRPLACFASRCAPPTRASCAAPRWRPWRRRAPRVARKGSAGSERASPAAHFVRLAGGEGVRAWVGFGRASGRAAKEAPARAPLLRASRSHPSAVACAPAGGNLLLPRPAAARAAPASRCSFPQRRPPLAAPRPRRRPPTRSREATRAATAMQRRRRRRVGAWGAGGVEGARRVRSGGWVVSGARRAVRRGRLPRCAPPTPPALERARGQLLSSARTLLPARAATAPGRSGEARG